MTKAELRSRILKAKQAYYFGGHPIMTDDAYDNLESQLYEIDPNDPILQMVGCPIPPDTILTKAPHKMPMISQDKVNTEAEFRVWCNKINNGNFNIHISYKGDGSSVAAYYEDGKMVQAISRGDGYEGEDITSLAMKFKGLPAYIEHNNVPFNGSIRFEAILTKADWAAVGGKNPRNMGSGIIGRKNGIESEYITAYAFDVANGIEFATETEKSQTLETMGVNTMPWITAHTIDDAIAYYNQTMQLRGDNNSGSLDLWIDGLVFRVDDIKLQKEIGMAPSGKYSKGQIAWKPKANFAQTTLRDIIFSAGHGGEICPNARFDPVEIGGTTVTNAYLNNWEEIKRLDVAIGDTIEVTKRNEIIPKIERVVSRPNDRRQVPEPTICPFCGGPIGRNETLHGDGAITICKNPKCPAKEDLKLRTWIKKTNILGIGDSVRKAFREQLNIHTPADLYRLGTDIPADEIREVLVSEESKLGRNADYIIEQIDAKRNLTLPIFLGSLGINKLGRREVEIAMEKASDELASLDDWRCGKLRDCALRTKINAQNKGIAWVDGIEKMSDIIDGLLANGVSIVDNQQLEKPTGGSICITGTLPSGKKKAEYKQPLAELGYDLVNKVSKNLDILVVADPTQRTNKLIKAEKYGIKIIGEDELIEMLSSV